MIPNDTEIIKDLYCDVAIVGGNIAGAYLAYLLSSKNINVIVIEEHLETGKPMQCSGIISRKLLKLVEVEPQIILNRIKKAILVSPSGKSIEMSGNEKPVVIDRSAFDYSFYQKAKINGALFLFKEKFRSYKTSKNKIFNEYNIIIYTNKRKIYSKIIVGADGPLSKVAKQNNIRYNIIYGVQIRAKYEFQLDRVKMYFNPKWKELFGWIIPEGNGICRIGLGVYKNPRHNFDEFLKLIGLNKNNIISYNSGVIPYGYIRKLALDYGLLLGDAGCMVKATTGGGVIMLLIASKIASESIEGAIKSNNYSKSYFKKRYEKVVKKKIGKELKIHYIIRKMLEKFSDEDYDQLFDVIEKNSKINEIINLYADMDFPKSLILKLLTNRNIILFGIKFLFKNLTFLLDLIKIFFNIYKINEKLK